MYNFYVGPEIINGEHTLNYLGNMEDKNILIITDQSMIKLGIISKVEEIIKPKGNAYQIFSDVESDPSLEIVKKGLSVFTKEKPDILLAIGGGSAIDVAKVVLYFSIQIQKQLVEAAFIKKPTFIAIPTTSGSGSEVTSYTVVTDSERKLKIPIKDRLMIPDVAILDESLTESLPPKLTAETGMDVLTHALEAMVSKKATVFTDVLAEKAIHLVFTHLPQAYHYGHDLFARRQLHIASCMAGIAFENASLGINHSLAHAIGAKFHLSHGKSNAILLPYVIAYNAGLTDGSLKHSTAAEKYAEIAKGIGYSGESTEQGVKCLMMEITKLNQTLSIPISLNKMLIDKNIFEKHLPKMAKSAMKDICTRDNPKKACERSLTEILKSAY
ncbi:1-propanol dehydrogenase PduQ [Oceanobacillus halophilus]|uniref:Iron-containing alcohol dehydrogenase n=1 Tax=Oceanobacillus halophilus TaxID=930130 RepID=A0A494ZSZ4_9BACI|nr:1-propanol dehydrogenase PduQ [Oceanobacillus halophilus]RKQ29245.1 iron-containing alcohol dehydrogenase [Oceanobacillus halophilus]